MFSLLNQLRWADLIVIVIIARCIYIGVKRGLGIEIFKLAGVFITSFACLHFYPLLGSFISSSELIPVGVGNFLAFLLIFVLFMFFFRLVRELFLMLIKVQPAPVIDKWGGAFLGGIRSIFIAGLVLLLFIASPINYLERGAKISFFGEHTFGTVLKAYSFTIKRFVGVIFPDEELNQQIFKDLEE